MKRGQFELSFGFIFSVILIAVFIVVAVIAINAFLDIRCSAETGKFIQDLKVEVNRIWTGAGYEGEKEFNINGCGIEFVCFYSESLRERGEYSDFIEDFKAYTGEEGEHNLYFYPRDSVDIPSTFINHVNMSSFSKNPYCFENKDNKIKINFEKRVNEAIVRIS